MAQTISELEKERAELLKAIESQAQQISSDRNGQDEPAEHTLKDWLNAAEEVMPSKPKPRNPQNTAKTSNMNPKTSFFGVVIMLSLLLTILGVVYIAYTSIQKELNSVLTMKEETIKELLVLKETVTEIQQNTAAAGQGSLFKQLQDQVALLEKEVRDLKAQKLIAPSTESGNDAELNKVVQTTTEALPDNVVTTEVLDAKLKEYTKGIEAKLERILMALPQTSNAEQNPSSSTGTSMAEPQINPPAEPSVKPLNQPVVRLVKPVDPPKSPSTTQAPLLNYSDDVKWLMNEPAFNFTLQLASMSERASVQKLIDDKSLSDTRIIPQDRNGVTRYVLVTGSYASRTEADNAASAYKANFGLSPWVRKIKDISAKVKYPN